MLIVREDLETEQRRHGSTALRKSADIDFRVPVIKEGDAALFEVESERFRAEGQAVLVPEAADDVDPGQGTSLFDLLVNLDGPVCGGSDVVDQRLVGVENTCK